MNGILKSIYSKNKLKRLLWVIVGAFICACTYNIFILPYNIVFGGVGGISIVFERFLDIRPSVLMLFFSFMFCLIGFIFLSKEKVMRSILGGLLFPVFVEITSSFASFIKIDTFDMLLISLFGGCLYGIGLGLIMKSGYTLGGTDFLTQIISKYFKLTMGTSMLIVEGLIVVSGAFVFGITNFMYAVLILYLITFLVDKVILGISDKKAFYIVTSKSDEVCDYVIKELGHTVTMFSASGGFSKKEVPVLFTVIFTKEYYKLKEGIRYIDEDAFFTVVDAYEVSGGE